MINTVEETKTVELSTEWYWVSGNADSVLIQFDGDIYLTYARENQDDNKYTYSTGQNPFLVIEGFFVRAVTGTVNFTYTLMEVE